MSTDSRAIRTVYKIQFCDIEDCYCLGTPCALRAHSGYLRAPSTHLRAHSGRTRVTSGRVPGHIQTRSGAPPGVLQAHSGHLWARSGRTPGALRVLPGALQAQSEDFRAHSGRTLGICGHPPGTSGRTPGALGSPPGAFRGTSGRVPGTSKRSPGALHAHSCVCMRYVFPYSTHVRWQQPVPATGCPPRVAMFTVFFPFSSLVSTSVLPYQVMSHVCCMVQVLWYST